MKIDHKAREEAKRKKMAHPDWQKYSGFPPESASVPPEEPKRKKAKPVEAAPEPESEPDGNGD